MRCFLMARDCVHPVGQIIHYICHEGQFIHCLFTPDSEYNLISQEYIIDSVRISSTPKYTEILWCTAIGYELCCYLNFTMLYFDDDAVINPQRANATHVSSKKTKEKKRYIRLKTDVNTGQRQIKQCCADQMHKC